jgi:hypothetical protein
MRTEPVPAARIGIGLDFGTSNSAAAWFDGQAREHHARGRARRPSAILPTAVHLDRATTRSVGSSAIARYVEENRGRRVELVATVIGEPRRPRSRATRPARTSRGCRPSAMSVYGPPVDRTCRPAVPRPQAPARRSDRSSASRVRQAVPARGAAHAHPAAHPRAHGARPRAAAAAHPRGAAGALRGRGIRPQPVASSRLTEALEHAGLASWISFGSEPVAATLSWLWRARPARGGLALTVDFGGGTLDLSLILAYEGMRFEVLATTGLALGGDRIDQMIFESLLFPELGRASAGCGPWMAATWTRCFRSGNSRPACSPGPPPSCSTRTARARWCGSPRARRARQREVPAPARPDLLQLQLQLFRGHQGGEGDGCRAEEHTVIDIPELNLQAAVLAQRASRPSSPGHYARSMHC